MTIRELINELEKLDENMSVYVYEDIWKFDANDVYVDSEGDVVIRSV